MVKFKVEAIRNDIFGVTLELREDAIGEGPFRCSAPNSGPNCSLLIRKHDPLFEQAKKLELGASFILSLA